MAERGTRKLTRGSDGLLHWKDVRNDLYNKEEQTQTDYLVKLIGTMIMRRKILGLTQEQLAERAGVKQSAIARLETGHAIPRMDTLFRVVDALELRLELAPKDHDGALEQSATALIRG